MIIIIIIIPIIIILIVIIIIIIIIIGRSGCGWRCVARPFRCGKEARIAVYDGRGLGAASFGRSLAVAWERHETATA